MKHVLSLWVLLVMVFLAASPAGAQEQRLPPFDVFVYMDASTTIFTKQQPGPNRRIVDMLKELFREPIDQGRPFVGANDRVFLYSFAKEVQPFSKGPIDGGSRTILERELDRLGSEGAKGQDQAFTNISTMLGHIRSNAGVLSELGKRQKVVLIASDFVDDTTNNTDKLCQSTADLEANPDKVPAQLAIDDLRRSLTGIERDTNGRLFVALLEMDEVQPNVKRDSNADCTNRTMRLARIQKELSRVEGIGALRIPYSSAEQSSRYFVDTMKTGIYRATLPALDVIEPHAEWKDDGITVRFSARNRGRIPNALRSVQLHREEKGASVVGKSYDPPSPIPPEEQVSREFPITGDAQRALTQNLSEVDGRQRLYLSIDDESRVPDGNRRTYPVLIDDVTPFTIKRVERSGDDGRSLMVEFANDGGAAKAPRSISFFDSEDASRPLIGFAAVKNASRLDAGAASRTESIVIPDPVIQRIRQGDLWITVDTGPDSRFKSSRYRVPRPNLQPIVIQRSSWDMIAGNRARLRLELNNPNPLPIALAKLALFGDNHTRVDGCEPGTDARLVKGRQAGVTIVTCDVDATPSAIFDSAKLSVQIKDEADADLSAETPLSLETLRREPLAIQSGEVRIGVGGTASIVLQVKNPNRIYALVRQVRLRNPPPGQDYPWQPAQPLRIAPGDATVTIEAGGDLQNAVNLLGPVDASLVGSTGEPGNDRPPFRLTSASRIPFPTIVSAKDRSPWSLDAPRLTIRVRNNANVPQRPELIALSTDSTGGNLGEFEVESQESLGMGKEADLAIQLTKPEDQARYAGARDVYVCVVKVAGAERRPCEDRERQKLPPLPPPPIAVDTQMDNGVAYTPVTQEIRLRLTNNGAWAGRPKAVWFLPHDGALQNPVKSSLPETTPLMKPGDVTPVTVKLAPTEWNRVFSPVGVRLQPLAVVGDATSPVTAASDFALRPVENIMLTIGGSWIQKSPAGDHIVVRIDVGITRTMAGAALPNLFVTLIDSRGNPVSGGAKDAPVVWQGSRGTGRVDFLDVVLPESDRDGLQVKAQFVGVPFPPVTELVRPYLFINLLMLTYPALIVLVVIALAFLGFGPRVPAYLGRTNTLQRLNPFKIDESRISKFWEWTERIYAIPALFGLGSIIPSGMSVRGVELGNVLMLVMIGCSAGIAVLLYRRLRLLQLDRELNRRIDSASAINFTKSIIAPPFRHYVVMVMVAVCVSIITAIFLAPVTSPAFILAYL